MIKETKINKEIIERHKFCDVCGAEITIGLRCSIARCEYCRKDLCEKCVAQEGYADGDYRRVYCERCWGISAPYRKVSDELHNNINQLYSDCWKEIEEDIKTEKIQDDL